MKSTDIICLDKVSYHVNGQPIIKDVSLTIQDNHVVSIIGYNGSGKSTLLKMMVGALRPTTGTVSINSGSQIGYVPQKLSFSQHLPISVKDFLTIYNSSSDIKHSPFSCSVLEIGSLMERPLSGLSGGQLQKVLIYNALLGKPRVILLDEPTAGLDVHAQQDFYELIEHIHQTHGVTIVIVSHDVHTVYSKSDLVICLHQGVCCTGAPGDSRFGQEVTDLFGGYVVPYLHTHQHGG